MLAAAPANSNDPRQTLNDFFSDYKVSAACEKVFSRRNFLFVLVRLGPGTRFSKLNNLAKEMALKLNLSVPMIQLLPDRGLVQLQFASAPQKLDLIEYYQSQTRPSKMNLPFLLGESDQGEPMWVDMSKNPHLLIAGATGSGKSVCLHNIIFNASQNQNIELFLSDPKQVELSKYKDEHFVVNSYAETLGMLKFIEKQMNSRFKFLEQNSVAEIWQLPDNFRLTSYLVILDEIGDLLLQDQNKELESVLIRLAQKGRAAGIYLVAATQRPSVDIFSGAIKANFPARLSFRVGSKVDSSVILDEPGAEKLLGLGDALFRNPNIPLTRLQVAYIN